MTIANVEGFNPEVIVVPLGSTEPHGPHLPYGTDTMIGDAISERAVLKANAEGARALRLPPLPFGNNVNFKAFPFACRIKVRTLMTIIGDLVEFAMEEGIRKVVFLNSHGGNAAAVNAALREVFDRFQGEMFACAVDAGPGTGELYRQLFKDGSAHAGDFETSLIMHLADELVNHQALAPQAVYGPGISFLNDGSFSWVRAWDRLMPSSSGGRPDHASAEKGEAFFNRSVENLARFLVELSQRPWCAGFPYEAPQKG